MIRSAEAKPLVVKLGGSLAGSDRLANILDHLFQANRRIAVVPGGGAFAEGVRAAQQAHGFTDLAAHRMALLAMHQMAELYFELQPGTRPAESVEAFFRRWETGELPVWLPLRLAGDDDTVPQDWSMTSDALAAWLAPRLGGDLLLVKSCRVDPAASATRLASHGVVDRAFPRIVSEASLTWRVVGAGDDDAIAEMVGPAA